MQARKQAFHPMLRRSASVALATLALFTIAASAQSTAPAQAEIRVRPGPIKGAISTRDNARGTVWCEVIPVDGTTPDAVGQIYNSSGTDDCTEERSGKLDPVRLAAELNVPRVILNTGRYWVFDKYTVFSAGETVDFHGVKAQWVANMTLQNMQNVLSSKPYTAARITRDTEWLYLKGRPVYLLRTPEGIVWIMQVFSRKIDKTLSLETLDRLGGKLQLPEGWKFEVKVLDRDLSLQPRWADGQAHILWDSLGNAYQGCGFDKACAFLP